MVKNNFPKHQSPHYNYAFGDGNPFIHLNKIHTYLDATTCAKITLSDKNSSDTIDEILAWWRMFCLMKIFVQQISCLTENFVQQIFCLMKN